MGEIPYDRGQAPLAFAISAVCDKAVTSRAPAMNDSGIDARLGLKFSLFHRMGVTDLAVAMAAARGAEKLSETQLLWLTLAAAEAAVAPEQQDFLRELEQRVRMVLAMGGYACPPGPG
jgi:hypothetical protein